MAVARGAQRLALAVRALCKIIGNNPDVVNPDANPLRRAVYDSVTVACDLFDEFVPPRTPTGSLAYNATTVGYADSVDVPTNFDRSAGKLIVEVSGTGVVPFRYSVRLAKHGVDDDVDLPESEFITEVEEAWSLYGQQFANMHLFGLHAIVVAAKRNVQGHLIDVGLSGATISSYTSAQPANPEQPYIITTITYKDQNGKQDRILLPSTYLALGKVVVEGNGASSNAVTALIGKLSNVDSFLSTRAGGAAIGNVMSISTISNEKLYRRFFA